MQAYEPVRIDVGEAAERFEEILDAFEAGTEAEIVLTVDGRDAARLIPFGPPVPQNKQSRHGRA